VELRFQRLTEAARLPTRAHAGDAGLDLYAAEAVVVPPAGGRTDVGTGVAVEIPPGHAGLVLPRSGSARKHGITLTNAPGLIDAGYRGELRVLILNTDPTEAFEIAPGDRIAQLVIVAAAPTEPVEVDELAASERGTGGFGSSGR
jgi:dUTP pyrophosphatase